jgi:hypothetical protein
MLLARAMCEQQITLFKVKIVQGLSKCQRKVNSFILSVALLRSYLKILHVVEY